MISSPSALSSPYSTTHPRVGPLLALFHSAQISSKQLLLNQWKSEPKFLLKEYLPWIPDPLKKSVKEGWPFLNGIGISKVKKVISQHMNSKKSNEGNEGEIDLAGSDYDSE